MSDSMEGEPVTPSKTPIHLWVVGTLALLWNSMGAVDYLMTETHNEEWLSPLNPEQMEFLVQLPAWVIGCWATAVWGSVLASGLLLAKNRRAVSVFLVSLVTLIAVRVHMYVLSDGLHVFGEPQFLILNGIIFTGAVCLYFYSRAMRERGVLR